jgi:hypothetical protein
MRSHVFGVMGCIGALILCAQHATIAKADEKPSEPAKADREPDLSKFPRLQGKIGQVVGHVGSFVPPGAGESFQLELKDVLKLQQLSFNAGKSHIPLPAPVVVESIHYYSNGAFRSMRLVSKEGSSSVTIDVVPKPGLGPKRVLVWVIVQSEVVQRVALMDCEYEGAFSDRRK